MKTVNQVNSLKSGFTVLNRSELKQIIGGVSDPPVTQCGVYCGKIYVPYDCGPGVSCSANGDTVTCGDGSTHNLCKK